jgi:ubiquitin carboxyl-terminal hydrolase 7/11
VKSLTFVTLPPTLIIHLSRFLFYDTSQKDDTVIQYPLILTIPHSNEHVKYRLFGVVNHSGTLKSGHYTSITNKNLTHDLKQPNWYYFDDEVVKGTGHGVADDRDCDRMNSSTVYVLFYEKM